jgi:HSP20 family protein
MFWDISPWAELEALRRRVDEAFGRSGQAAGAYSYPLVNVYDKKDDLVVVAEMPGMKKEDINIVMANGVLTLSGKRGPLLPEDKADLIRTERSVGGFEKSFRVPVKVKEDKVNAAYSNGMLIITIPKAEEARPKSIAIDVK